LFIFSFSFFTKNNTFKNKYFVLAIELLLIALLSIIIGFRNLASFPDNISYKYFFESSLQTNFIEFINASSMEIGFSAVTWLIGNFTEEYKVYFTILFLIFIFVFMKFLNEVFFEDRLIILAVFISTPFFISFSANIIRNGLAISFLLLGSIYLFKNRRHTLAIFYLILGITFHNAVIPFALFILGVKYIKFNLKTIVSLWLISIIFFLTKAATFFIPMINELEYFKRYTSATSFDSYGGGAYRMDFLLFNTILVLITLFLNVYIENKEKKDLVDNYLKMVLLSAIVFNVFSFISYSDRLAIYVWLFFVVVSLLALSGNLYRNIIMPMIMLFCFIFIFVSKNFIFFS